jgi:hypothetical protein
MASTPTEAKPAGLKAMGLGYVAHRIAHLRQ